MSVTPPAIAGLVLDAKGKPVEGARVYFEEGPVALPEITARTDSRGRFALSPPIQGTYQIGITAEGSAGLAQKTMTVDVGKERSVDLEMRLDTQQQHN